jgi:Ni/Fe-hydrogenase subunit HybB-like protein
MRKLFHATAALSVLLATSMAANAADVYARPRYAPPPLGPDFILAATLAGPGLTVT